MCALRYMLMYMNVEFGVYLYMDMYVDYSSGSHLAGNLERVSLDCVLVVQMLHLCQSQRSWDQTNSRGWAPTHDIAKYCLEFLSLHVARNRRLDRYSFSGRPTAQNNLP